MALNITYILLAFTVSTSLFIRSRKLILCATIITITSALLHGIINLESLLAILLLFGLSYTYFSYGNLSRLLKTILFLIIILLITGFLIHIIPGFANSLVIDKERLTSLSCPFSMYLNFDKTIAALVIYITSGLSILEKPVDKKSILYTTFYLSLCAGFVSILGISTGYIKFEPKLPDILPIWVLNNMLFVCMAEEVIFRGFVQTHLKKFFNKKTNFQTLHITITSLIFGLAHFKGGVLYVILASICGWFYGYAYERTNRILCAMLVHFGLNLIHLTLFTYPVLCA
ncbi:MAG: CPBP family intramembrane metalloprotease [Rickettsiales bacterium]|nr:CPBP family intramembrane metalloprotease [Rickettsiales bacterium]